MVDTAPQELDKSAGDDQSACEICGGKEEGGGSAAAGDSSTSADSQQQQQRQESFALRCNCCRRWFHPWCMGYQLDLDRSCLITASDVDIPIDSVTGLPLVCQWFCDSCSSTVTGVVAATAGRRQQRRLAVAAGLTTPKSKKGKKGKHAPTRKTER
ncbi:unnamed protein product [Ectocarpus sp. 6 AP-2014]